MYIQACSWVTRLRHSPTPAAVSCHRKGSHARSLHHPKCKARGLSWKSHTEGSKLRSPHKGLATRQLSACLIFVGQWQKAVCRNSRKPEGQRIKNKALHASWKGAVVSFISNYHSNQLSDSQWLSPQCQARSDAVTLLGTVARQRHTCNSSTVASLQGSLNKKRGRKKTLDFIYT